MRVSYKMQVYKGKKGGWYIRIVARNGKIVMDGGEAYPSKSNAVRASIRFAASFIQERVKVEII